MSRSNPETNISHPCTRWHEWNGAKDGGNVRYYDKEKKEQVNLPPDFTFILLDEMKTIKGWNKQYGGIGSNEVRDTTAEPFVVKYFKSPNPIAVGIYKDIREKVLTAKGHFTLNLYIAYRSGRGLAIGSLQLKGGALAAWSEFRKKYRMEVYQKAVRIKGSTKGISGTVEFSLPIFSLCDITPESEEDAKKLDVVLQDYLKVYLAKTTPAKAVETQKSAPPITHPVTESDDSEYTQTESLDIPAEDIPF